VRKTGRLVVVDPARMTCGAAGEVIAGVVTSDFDALKTAPVRVTAPDVPMPFSPTLEKHVVVSAAKIEAAVRSTLTKVVVGPP
jgi:pyruvate dehydrogenase E1 component beta subunit